MYKIDSQKAEEFICHEEILDTLEYAQSKSQDKELIRSIIEKLACARDFLTARLLYYWNATTRNWWRKSTAWPVKSSRNSMVTAS